MSHQDLIIIEEGQGETSYEGDNKATIRLDWKPSHELSEVEKFRRFAFAAQQTKKIRERLYAPAGASGEEEDD